MVYVNKKQRRELMKLNKSPRYKIFFDGNDLYVNDVLIEYQEDVDSLLKYDVDSTDLFDLETNK